MRAHTPGEITARLERWPGGTAEDRERLFASVPSFGVEARRPGGGPDLDVVALHDAPNDLATFDARQAEIVELRYFAGLTEEEVAKAKALSPGTIRRETAAARF